jgi:hypothetical protein
MTLNPDYLLGTSNGNIMLFDPALVSGTSQLAGNTLVVDQVNGHDSGPTPGTRGRLDRPFHTIEAAEDASQEGDEIIIRPGVYSVGRGIGKNNRTYSGSSAVTVTRAITSVTTDTFVFGDGGTAMIFFIDGRMTITMTGTVTTTTSTQRCAVVMASAGSLIDVQCRKISQQVNVTSDGWAAAVQGYKLLDDTGMNVMVRCSQIEATGTRGRAAYWYSGEMHLDAFTYTASDMINGIGIHSEFAPVPTSSQQFYVRGDLIKAAFAVFSDSQAEAKLWVGVQQLQAANGYTALFNSGGKVYYIGSKISGNTQSDATLGVIELEGSGDLSETWAIVSKVTSTYGPAINITGGINRLFVQHVEDLGNVTQAVNVSGGISFLDGMLDCRIVTGDGITVSGGVLNVISPYIDTTLPAHDLVQTGGTLNIAGGGGSQFGSFAGAFTFVGTVSFSSQQFGGVSASFVQFSQSLELNNGNQFGVTSTGQVVMNGVICLGLHDVLNGNQIESSDLRLVDLPNGSDGLHHGDIYYDSTDSNRLYYFP